jgi:23S rRNA pseudouridine2605 synthase
MPNDGARQATAAGGPVRVQKVLASAGLGSRRACEELVAAGRVTIDGEVATLGDRVDPARSVVHVDGERVATDPRGVYLAFHKPRGVVSTMDDEHGRAALADYLGRVEKRVFHVGRLDADSEGLLLLTNDGDLAHRLTHPSYGVAKTYVCQVPGPVPRTVGRALREGVTLADGVARADSFRVLEAVGRKALVEVVLHEGRKHIVRRMLSELGFPVKRLVRTAVGPVRLGNLKPGQFRRLSRQEITALYVEAEESVAG